MLGLVEAFWAYVGPFLGPFWAYIEVSSANVASTIGHVWHMYWAFGIASWAMLGLCWAHAEPMLKHLGPMLGHVGPMLGQCWAKSPAITRANKQRLLQADFICFAMSWNIMECLDAKIPEAFFG